MKWLSPNPCLLNNSVSTRSSSKWSAVGKRWQQNESVSARSVKQSVGCQQWFDSSPSYCCPHESVSHRLRRLSWVGQDLVLGCRTLVCGRWGIVKMVRGHFYSALSTIATLTQTGPSTIQVVETHSLYGRGGLLKILVSAVRFCPGPPPNTQALPLCRAFSLVAGISCSVAQPTQRCPHAVPTVKQGCV